MITPSVSHLEELRSLLFDKIEEKEPDKLAKRAEKYFVIENKIPLKLSAHII